MATPSWRIEFQSRALRELDRLDDNIRRDAIEAIRDLGEDPFPLDAEALTKRSQEPHHRSDPG